MTAKGLTEHGAITNRGRWVLRVREEQCEAAARRLSQGVLDFGDAS